VKFIGIIPARYSSSRLPGKPLLDIQGKTMIRRVYEQAGKALEHVYVATDDQRIVDEVNSFGGNVVLTKSTHQSGTDRCAEAIEKIGSSGYDVVINIQGDEPFIHPEQLTELMSCFEDERIQIATLIKKVQDGAVLANPNVPKVIISYDEMAIYFSRTAVPYVRNVKQDEWHKHHTFYKHIGIYAYKISTLKDLTMLPVSSLEKAELLEQNRWLENGYKIKTKTTSYQNHMVDTPDDYEKIKNIKDHYFEKE
jgi:3-deoxy-manno-octulosonate cytidylyltransferase (CMP-KDO synthetase)